MKTEWHYCPCDSSAT